MGRGRIMLGFDGFQMGFDWIGHDGSGRVGFLRD
jgi:hypothetical protein